MKNILLVLCAVVLISAAATAQIKATARGTVAQPAVVEPVPAAVPAGCNPCLWYSGDSDLTASNYSGLFNANATELGKDAQVWVPFIPASDGNPLHKHVDITAITFNEATSTGSSTPPTDFVGMTYGFRTGILTGNGGKLGKNGKCETTSVVYTGESADGLFEFAYTCNLATPVKLAVGTIGWVNVLPEFNVSNFAFLDNSEGLPPINGLGWSDDFENSFWTSNAALGGDNFKPAEHVGTAFDNFSVAIAGTYVD